jgi:regulator of sigma E protease
VIFFCLALAVGVPSERLSIAKMGALPEKYVNELEIGDEVLAIEGEELGIYSEIGPLINMLPIEKTLDYRVLRGGDEIIVQGPHPRPPLASGISFESAARDAGVEVGDVVTAVNGAEIFVFDELVSAVTYAEGETVVIDVWRNGETLQFDLTPRVTAERTIGGGFTNNYRIGIAASFFWEPGTESIGIWDSATNAVWRVWDVIQSSIQGLVAMVTGAISSCNLSGPIGIAQASGAMASEGATTFIMFVALLSTAVGLLNLFPIPILDGGHLVFHAYEAVTGTPPSEGALRILMAVGLALIGTLMIFAVGSDLFC